MSNKQPDRTLAELQAEWREEAADVRNQSEENLTYAQCADDLQPFIAREQSLRQAGEVAQQEAARIFKAIETDLLAQIESLQQEVERLKAQRAALHSELSFRDLRDPGGLPEARNWRLNHIDLVARWFGLVVPPPARQETGK